jgi:hypothetical protein
MPVSYRKDKCGLISHHDTLNKLAAQGIHASILFRSELAPLSGEHPQRPNDQTQGACQSGVFWLGLESFFIRTAAPFLAK